MGLENNWPNEGAEGNQDKIASSTFGSPSSLTHASFFRTSQTDEATTSILQSDPPHQSGGVAGVCGLLNLGNTCFMSAGVQCLVATPPLARALLEPQAAQHALTRDLAELTRQIWSGQYSAVQPTQFKNSLSKYYPQFKDFRQHDCQEFLALLLDGLHEQMNTASKLDNSSQAFTKGKFCDNLKAVNVKDCSLGGSPELYTAKLVGKASDWEMPGSYSYNLDLSCYKAGTSTAASGDMAIETINGSPKKLNNNTGHVSELPTSPKLLNIVGNSWSKAGPSRTSKVIDSLDSNNQEIQMEQTVCNDIPQSEQQYSLNNCSLGSSSEHGVLSKDSLLHNPVNNTNHLSSYDDILKNAKTSNVNVMAVETPDQPANNSIRFDSEKYPRVDNIKKKEGFNYNALGSCGVGKRTPDSVRVGFDLKRVKLEDDEEKNSRADPPSPKLYLEKNIRMECERKERSTEGDSHWQNHLANNRSVVVSTFQGQFKSQVVCSVCQYVSITYEPFMYLSVPLPNAMKKELKVIYVDKFANTTEINLEMDKNKSVMELKEKMLEQLGVQPEGQIVMAEVLNHHVAKILDDHTAVWNVNNISRSIYAFELVSLDDDSEKDTISWMDSESKSCSDGQDELSCNICLEEKDINLKKHKNCTFLICDNCISSSCEHYGESWRCPTCSDILNPCTDLKPLKPNTNLQLRLVKVCIVYRMEKEMDKVELIGHPMIVRLPNLCQSDWLLSVLRKISPYNQSFTARFVDGQGLWCGQCMYSEHCRGCTVSGRVKLSPTATIAICLSTDPIDPVTSLEPTSELSQVKKHNLTIYDCINAFSQSEVLDSNNPWFCPNCKKNQCATKTLTIWRYPDYLIVYLKRFVFHDHISTKIDDRVEFPLDGLELSSGLLYDLYACVCHVGGVSVGHYTTYALHSQTGVWHYFNDCTVQTKAPRESDYSSAYILFYKKRSA